MLNHYNYIFSNNDDMYCASIFLVSEASMQDWLCGEPGHISSRQILKMPWGLWACIVSFLIQSWVSLGHQQKSLWKGKCIHCATGTVRGRVCHVKPPYAAPITTAVPVWLPTSKLLAFLNMHSEFYFPVLQTMQFPKSTKGQAFIPSLKEYALGSFPFLFSFGGSHKNSFDN